MAYVDLRKIGRAPRSGKVHEINYRDSSGRRRYERFPTKREALEFEAKIKLNLGGVRASKRSERTIVNDAFEKWMKYLSIHGGRSNDGISPSTRSGYESIHAQWIASTLGEIPLAKLDRETVDDWRMTMVSANGMEPSPRQRGAADAQLARLLAWCQDQEYLSDNPAKTRSGAPAPRAKVRKKKQHIYLDNRQVWRLAAHAPDETTRNIILTMATTGLRFGEVAALTAGDLDPDTGEIRVHRAYAMDRGKLYIARTKSHEERTVMVAGNVLTLLADRASALMPDDLLFTTLTGRPINRDNWADRKFGKAAKAASTAVARLQGNLGAKEHKGPHAWFGPKTAAAVERAQKISSFGVAGIGEQQFDAALSVLGETVKIVDLREGDIDFPTPTPHDMRHTAASVAIRSGASVKAVQAMLGHSSAKVTLDTYAGLFPSEQAAVATAMANALSMPE